MQRCTAGCQCGNQAFEPVCALGITYDTPCDAECSGQGCYNLGQCQYTIDRDLVFIDPADMSNGRFGEPFIHPPPSLICFRPSHTCTETSHPILFAKL